MGALYERRVVSASKMSAMVLAGRVQSLAKEIKAVVNNLQQVKKALNEVRSQLEREANRFESIQEQLELGGGGRGMAQVLLDIQQRFPDKLAFLKGLDTQVIENFHLHGLLLSLHCRGRPVQAGRCKHG